MQRAVPVQRYGEEIHYGLGLHRFEIPGCGTFRGSDGTVWGAQTMSLISDDGTRQISVAMNLVRWNALDPSGAPQHHPIDDALTTLYRQAMCGDGTAYGSGHRTRVPDERTRPMGTVTADLTITLDEFAGGPDQRLERR
jgi:D-alanyl-D-alanine carboxypeptidase